MITMATLLGTRSLTSPDIRTFSSTDECVSVIFIPHCLESEVGVHERVDDEVHDDKPACRGGVLTEGVPAVDEDRDVVIPPGSVLSHFIIFTVFTSAEISVSVSLGR